VVVRHRAQFNLGFDTLEAERTLSVLEANLDTFQEHRRSLEREEQ